MIRKKRGYTLLEILMVMGIIGILLAVSASAFLSARLTARDARRKTDLEQIRGAIETYKADKNVYPGSQSVPTQSSGNVSSLATFLVSGSNQYISAIPSDPISTMQYYYIPTATGYYLCASLEGLPNTASTNCGSGDCGVSSNLAKVCNYEVKNP
ncbi:prepilin-type N-terminal cleavage/methylation domain-containing protein [Candidatus Gottesmanbacteria bacterium]|nr:prepilin-type N-terminal cleavage/methylation domain-containing protein [Candidatus Gottesmanbacteria bacterium]